MSRRDRENQWAFAAPPSAQERYGPGSRISLQASGNPQCAAASNRPDTRQRLTRRLAPDKEKPVSQGASTRESPARTRAIACSR